MRFRGMMIGVGLALLAVTAGSARVRSATAGEQLRVALLASVPIDTWSGGSWSWFSDPRAVHVLGPQDETFVGWIDSSGNVTIGAYDDNFGAMHSRVIGHLYHDDHGSPAILVEPDKRLTVFWSAHNGSTMNFRSTLRPEDISAWGPIDHVPARIAGSEGFTYQNPVLVPAEGNRLYLFWRGADWSQDYATRTVGGRWSPAHRLISAPGARPYLKVDADGSGAIALAFTDGHPREGVTSVYYAAYRNGSLWSASGRWIERLSSAPIAPRQADLVYNGPAADASGWVWDTAFDSRRWPVIVYATFPSRANHAYWYARWNGKRWVSHFMTLAGPTISPTTIEQQYSGGVALDHVNPAIVYLSRKVHGWFEIERWTTPDGGRIWRHAAVVRTPGSDNVRPVCPAARTMVRRGSCGSMANTTVTRTTTHRSPS